MRERDFTPIGVFVFLMIIGISAVILIPVINRSMNADKASETQRVIEPKTVELVDLGNGIYRFDLRSAINYDDGSIAWRDALLKFRKANPNLVITAIAPAEQRPHGAWLKILVITEPKQNR